MRQHNSRKHQSVYHVSMHNRSESSASFVSKVVSLFTTPVGQFRLAAITEAWSWAGLLAGMYFKYSAAANPIGVQMMGPIHGGLFIFYVIATIRVAMHMRWGMWTTVIGIFAALPPFCTYFFEVWMLRSRRLEVRPRS
jgi:integral membrane protein